MPERRNRKRVVSFRPDDADMADLAADLELKPEAWDDGLMTARAVAAELRLRIAGGVRSGPPATHRSLSVLQSPGQTSWNGYKAPLFCFHGQVGRFRA